MWKKLDPKKLDDPNVQREIGVRLARLKHACVKYDQFIRTESVEPKNLTKMKEAFEEFEDANEDYNNFRETLFKK